LILNSYCPRGIKKREQSEKGYLLPSYCTRRKAANVEYKGKDNKILCFLEVVIASKINFEKIDFKFILIKGNQEKRAE